MTVQRIGISTMTTGGVLALLATVLLVLPAGAAHVDPVQMDDNPKCTGESGPHQPSLEMDDGVKVEEGDLVAAFDDGSFSVDLVFDVEAGTLSFSNASPAVAAVIMKGGPVANVYFYDPSATADDGLVTPTNPNNDKAYGISHVSFCFEEPEPSPSPTPSPTATPTPSPTPTVTPSPSPTATPSPTVTSSPAPSPSPTTEVLGLVLENPPADMEQLPMTGPTEWLLVAALAMMAGGGLLLVPTRAARRP